MKIQHHRHDENRGHHYWSAIINHDGQEFKVFITGTPSVCNKRHRLFYIADFHRDTVKRLGFHEISIGTSDDVFLGKIKQVLIGCKRVVSGDYSKIKGIGFVCSRNIEDY